jgi:hypothetical protein
MARGSGRSYYGNINSRKGGFRNGYGAGQRGNKSFNPMKILSSNDALKDAERYGDVHLSFCNIGASGSEGTLTVAESGLSSGSGAGGYNVLNLALDDTSLNGVIIEPLAFTRASRSGDSTHAIWQGKKGYLKHINMDLSVAATGAAGDAPVEIYIDVCRVLGGNDWLETSNVSFDSYDKDHTGSNRVYKLLSKRLTIMPNQPCVKVKLFRAFNQIFNNPVASVGGSGGIDIDRQCERLCIIMKMKKFNTATGQTAKLCVHGKIKIS